MAHLGGGEGRRAVEPGRRSRVRACQHRARDVEHEHELCVGARVEDALDLFVADAAAERLDDGGVAAVQPVREAQQRPADVYDLAGAG